MAGEIYMSDRKALRLAWEEFINTGKVKSAAIRPEIMESWQRCYSYGLDPYAERIAADIGEGNKAQKLKENQILIKTARPFLEGLFELIKSLDMVVFLTDASGNILDALGEGEIWQYCQAKNAVAGSSFQEKHCGTNAPAMALRLGKPYQMIAEEHYLEAVHVATCAAAPIRDHTDRIIGSLDITASHETALKHPHTLGMISASAQVIENQLQLKNECENSFLKSQYLKAAMETMASGLLILDKNDRITHMNPAAERMLGVSFSTITNNNLRNVISNATILSSLEGGRELQDHEIILHESIAKSRCLVSLKPIFNPAAEGVGNVLLLKELRTIQKLVQKVAGLEARYDFTDIVGQSPAIEKTIDLAKKAARGKSNLMILGESGTGKEMLAQSIHNASPFAAGPFLGINCAAIPVDLIESELFGYEAGTFTGGLRNGKSGKLELANGGTLFLDEVNGMSLALQVKLLRVLEEKSFQRLGGKDYLKLEARIIAATNKDLQQEIEVGNFRGDLYYRLNVLEIVIPPLRERPGDIELLTHMFISTAAEKLDRTVEGIAPEAMQYLQRQHWPGNVRQLKNWIERAVHIAEGPILTLDCLPVEQASAVGASLSNNGAQSGVSAGELGALEKEAIIKNLRECSGNVTAASKRLGIGRATLYRKLKKFNISLTKHIS